MLVTARSGEMLVENDACVWKLLEFPRGTDPYPMGGKRWLVRAHCSFKLATYAPREVELSLGEDEMNEIFRACLEGEKAVTR